MFYCILDHINTALMTIKDVFQKHSPKLLNGSVYTVYMIEGSVPHGQYVATVAHILFFATGRVC